MYWFYDDVGVFDSEQSDACIDFTMFFLCLATFFWVVKIILFSTSPSFLVEK